MQKEQTLAIRLWVIAFFTVLVLSVRFHYFGHRRVNYFANRGVIDFQNNTIVSSKLEESSTSIVLLGSSQTSWPAVPVDTGIADDLARIYHEGAVYNLPVRYGTLFSFYYAYLLSKPYSRGTLLIGLQPTDIRNQISLFDHMSLENRRDFLDLMEKNLSPPLLDSLKKHVKADFWQNLVLYPELYRVGSTPPQLFAETALFRLRNWLYGDIFLGNPFSTLADGDEPAFDYLPVLRSIYEDAKSRGQKAYFYLAPCYLPSDWRPAGVFREFREGVIQYARSNSLPILDLSESVVGRENFVDAVHLSEKGRERFAQTLYSKLIEPSR